MNQNRYGILDLSNTWPVPKTHQFYKTEIDSDLLKIIDELGYVKAKQYFDSQNDRKFLVDRWADNSLQVLYPASSGGNFLVNCLILSKDILMANYPKSQDRSDWICSRYDEEGLYWNDVSLNPYAYVEIKSKFIFDLAHPEEGSVKKRWNFWPKSNKIIIFKNSSLFCALRKYIVPPTEYCVDESEPEKTLTKSDKLHDILNKYDINLLNYKDLSSNIRNEIKNIFNDKKSNFLQNYSYCDLKTKKQFYFWDVNWFLDKQEFLFNLNKIYDGLELSGFSQKLIGNCYDAWINAMCRSLRLRDC